MENYTFGALKNPVDYRDIPAMAFQPVTALPDKFMTDISILPVMDQKQIGSCVGHSMALYLQYLNLKETGEVTPISPRFIYAQAKRLDGFSGQGTYPRVAAKVTVDLGAGTEKFVPCDDSLSHDQYINIPNGDDAGTYKTKGYAFINPTLNEIKQAIINNGLVLASLEVGDFSQLPIKPGKAGLHYICIYGYDGNILHFRNSWSENWGNKGNGYLNFNDFDGKIHDIMVITDVPNNLKTILKGVMYKKGSTGSGVAQLQRDLKALGYFKYPIITGYFGSVTESAVMALQKATGLKVDGIAGVATLQKIEALKKKPNTDFGLLPEVARLADEFIQTAKTYGYNIKITEGYRTEARQTELYNQGRTTPGPIVTNAPYPKSLHCHGLAFDICFVGSDPYPADDTVWYNLSIIAKQIGLEAGYDFTTIKDRPHYQYRGGYKYEDIYAFNYKKEDFI